MSAGLTIACPAPGATVAVARFRDVTCETPFGRAESYLWLAN